MRGLVGRDLAEEVGVFEELLNGAVEGLTGLLTFECAAGVARRGGRSARSSVQKRNYPQSATGGWKGLERTEGSGGHSPKTEVRRTGLETLAVGSR